MAHTVKKVQRGKPQPAPISSHRLFPAMVALWFAALFGIGSLILPASLFDVLVGEVGLGKALPAAGSLAANAKLIFTLLATAAGAALGLALAGRVAAAQSSQPARRREFVTAAQPTPLERVSAPRKPLSVQDELLDSIEAEDADTSSRRRALAMEEPEGPSDWFHPNLPFSEIPVAPTGAVSPEPDPVREALDLAVFPMEEAQEPEIFEPVEQPAEPEPGVSEAVPVMNFAAPSWLEPARFDDARDFGPVDRDDKVVDGPLIAADEGELSQLGLSDLTERLNRAIRARAEQEAEQARTRAPMLVGDGPIADDGGLQSFFGKPQSEPDPAPDHVGPACEPFAEPETFEWSGFAAPVAAQAIPKALRPVLQEDFEDAEDAEDGFFTPATPPSEDGSREENAARQVFGSPLAYSEPEPAEEEEAFEGLADENYGSLADIAGPFRMGTEFVRVEEPEPASDSLEPAVIFPGQEARHSLAHVASVEAASVDDASARAPGFSFRRKSEAANPAFEPAMARPAPAPVAAAASADPAETERALRLALATLQRMSGAA